MFVNPWALVALLCAGTLLAGCGLKTPAKDAAPSQEAATVPFAAMPSGPVGKLAAYGRDILNNTPKYMKGFVRADMSCSACHIQSGTKSRGGSLVGVYARFSQYNKRANRVIALQDRIAECFLYSMNGRPPEYQSKEMIAIVAYLAQLSAGVPVGSTQDPSVAYDKFTPPSSPNQKRGAIVYSQMQYVSPGQWGWNFRAISSIVGDKVIY